MDNGHYHDYSFSPELIRNKAHDDDSDDNLFTKKKSEEDAMYFFPQLDFHIQFENSHNLSI